jgi:BlaI family transcriptional regulator, penicillinase repressor
MKRKTAARPTDGELEILRVLWRLGPSTVRDVHEALSDGRGTGYTTTGKLLQIMAGKGLVERDERDRAHVYRAAAAEDQTRRQLAGDLLDRAFDGSASAMLLHALESRKASREELQNIRRLLRNYERGEQ